MLSESPYVLEPNRFGWKRISQDLVRSVPILIYESLVYLLYKEVLGYMLLKS